MDTVFKFTFGFLVGAAFILVCHNLDNLSPKPQNTFNIESKVYELQRSVDNMSKTLSRIESYVAR